MNPLLLWLAAGAMVLIALFHSLAGHKVLIGPLLAQRDGLLAQPKARVMIAFGWHVGTVLTLLPAAYLAIVAMGRTPGNTVFISLIGLAFIGMGIANGLLTRFRHPGCALLSMAGISTFLSPIV